MADRRQLNNQVVVYLDRFALDKGMSAPSLRSHSVGLRVTLEFEVGSRKDKEVVVEEDHETRFKLTSAAQVSDTYTLDWLTWVSAKIWPSFESGFKALIADSLTSLAKSLPGPFKNIKMSAFSLGDAYPKFGPITASERKHDGAEVQLDIVLDYATDTNIVLDMSIARFAIIHLKIHGVISLKFKPILKELPVFAAMQILFLNSPTIDLKFANMLEIANSSMVRKIIFGAINRQLADLMVLPNIMNINWADATDLSDKAVNFRNVLPCAVLRLGVLEARSLVTDGSVFRSLPDAYAKGQLGSHVAQTRTIRQSAHPVWAQEYDLLLYDERQHISVSVFDIDLTGRSTNVGSALDVKASDIILAGQEGKWVDLLPQKGKARSQVLLKATVFDLHADPRLIEVHKFPTLSSKGATASSSCLRDPTFSTLTSSPCRSQPPVPKSPQSQSAEAETEHDGSNVDDANTSQGTDDALSLVGAGNIAVTTTREAGAVVLLACEIYGGRLMGDALTPKDLLLQVSVGEASGEKPCSEAPPTDPGTIGEKTQKTIERLAALSLTADVIAEAVGESAADVQRIMRKQGWNLECNQKICVLAHPSDLASATNISFTALTQKKKFFGKGSLPLTRILQTTNARHSALVSLVDEVGSPAIDLDVELRMYALQEQKLEAERGQTVVV
jgi:hypothetical protein